MTLIDHIFVDSSELVNHRYLLFTQLSAGLCTYLAEVINKSTREPFFRKQNRAVNEFKKSHCVSIEVILFDVKIKAHFH